MSARYVEIVEGDPERQVRKAALTGHPTFLRDAMVILAGWQKDGVSDDAQVRIHEGTYAYGIPEKVHKGTLVEMLSWKFLGGQP